MGGPKTGTQLVIDTRCVPVSAPGDEQPWNGDHPQEFHPSLSEPGPIPGWRSSIAGWFYHGFEARLHLLGRDVFDMSRDRPGVAEGIGQGTSAVTLARYPAALSVSTLHASSSRRDNGQLNETVRGVFGSGHLGGGRAAWGLVTLGICIPIQPMTPAWARSETAQRHVATRSAGRGSLLNVMRLGLDPIMTPRQHRLDAPKDPRGASATGPGCRGWSWNSQIRGGCIGLMNCPERECVGVVLMSVGSLARSFAAGPRHNSGSDPRG